MKPPAIAAGILVLLSSLLSLPATASIQAVDDGRLGDAVAARIRSYPRLTIFDAVTGHVADGTVTLRGKVTLAAKKAELAAWVREVSGVRTVRTEIELLPSSADDEALRTRTARAIYGNATFWRYAALPHPPIRILVAHGHVTLAGALPTESERALAQSLAAGVGARSVVNALRVDVAAR